ncbi:uncharacterized protein GGS22DRAFT_200408 [Annulohypoxylon maeteangense]|uniref:uncharacterized protein n=1 Tax=Annulohypoxylon maeteangense TaxID=1927788 RepID=UPI00200856A4|nr:uncharacterized protein GGS22DRAFT_200408 [Annulohypoxylon maeteangense]KAI0884715.1 hypothetical protein GGS22DRAFT_200408 [Annulohypoxylon maeteangense]
MPFNEYPSGGARDQCQRMKSLTPTGDRNELSSPALATDKSSSPEAPQTVFTGEYRAPLRDRLRAMRQVLHGSKSGAPNGPEKPTLTPSPLDLNTPSTSPSIPSPPPPTPRRSRPTPLYLGTCPGAPIKSQKYLNLPISKAGTDSDDLLFDRRANQPSPTEVATSARRSADKANERQRRRITTPGAPSPLRSSFNADEMAELAVQLDAMTKEMAEKKDGEKAEPETFVMGFKRSVR